MAINNHPLVGLAGFTCEVTEESVSFQECLAGAKAGAPGCPLGIPAVLHNIVSNLRPTDYAQQRAQDAGADLGYSVTEVIGCTRQTRLKAQHPYWEKPSGHYRMAFGSGYHAALSEYPHAIVEKTLSWKFPILGQEVLITGTPDIVYPLQGGWRIGDYKVTGSLPFGKKVKMCVACGLELIPSDDGPACSHCGPLSVRSSAVYSVWKPPQARSSHAWQVNLYNLLIERNAQTLGLNGQGQTAEIYYLSQKTPMRCEVHLDKDATLAFLKSQLTQLLAPDLPAPLTASDEDAWRCDYCPLRAECESLHGGAVGKES